MKMADLPELAIIGAEQHCNPTNDIHPMITTTCPLKPALIGMIYYAHTQVQMLLFNDELISPTKEREKIQ